jgi:coenzyme F420-reducing hydrogenase delta subunit
MGVNPARLRLEWVSASEGQKFADIVKGFTAQLKELGPLAPAVEDQAVAKEEVHA